MNDRFTLNIELGNDAMQTDDDVAEALRIVANRLNHGQGEGSIRDLNGNTVGRFQREADND